MISKGPILLHGRQTNGTVLVCRDDISGSGSVVEIQVDVSTKGSPGDALGPQKNLLCMGVTEIDSMSVRDILGILIRGLRDIFQLPRGFRKVPSIQVDRMTPVDICVDIVSNISSKQRTLPRTCQQTNIEAKTGVRERLTSQVVPQTETMDHFTQTVEVIVLSHGGLKLDELILKHQLTPHS